MKSRKLVLLLLAALVLFSACVPGPNALQGTPDAAGEVAGFWNGWWHGFISPFTFIASLFTIRVAPYDVNNSGRWYNFGFMIGASMILGGGGGGATHASRRKRRDGED